MKIKYFQILKSLMKIMIIYNKKIFKFKIKMNTIKRSIKSKNKRSKFLNILNKKMKNNFILILLNFKNKIKHKKRLYLYKQNLIKKS